jgi:hypothetical protein
MKTSEQIIEIAKALSKFHISVGKIKKGSDNPFFKSKYASLPDILDTISEPLLECGLIITQHPEGEHQLTTMLIHAESGQFFESTYSMTPTKNDPQGLGSCITYMRRYAVGSILSLNIDEDDDGNAASGKGKPVQITEQRPVAPKAKNAELPGITNERVAKACELISKGDTKTKESLSKSFSLTMEQMLMVQDAEDLFTFNNPTK